jgi:hypothetical protein
MEGFLESFLYLLITIIILVLSMRKKKSVQQEHEEHPHQGDPFDGLFGDEEHEDNDIGAEPAKPYKEKVFSHEPSSPWISEADRVRSHLDADQVMREAAENNPIAMQENEVQKDHYDLDYSDNDGISFDLRKAVIYSEIIEKRIF